MESRVAVFVDGDNVSPAFKDEILTKAATYGRFMSARVYLDARKTSDWHAASGYRLIHAGCGKNAADRLLAIDALEMRMRDSIDAIVIASSDGDFSHLAHRLSEWGTIVIGIGQSKTPNHFRAACSDFHLIGPVNSPVIAKAAPATKNGKSRTKATMEANVVAAIKEKSADAKGMLVTDLSTYMRNRYGTQISSRPEKNWRNYLKAYPALFDLDPKGKEARVRVKTS